MFTSSATYQHLHSAADDNASSSLPDHTSRFDAKIMDRNSLTKEIEVYRNVCKKLNWHFSNKILMNYSSKTFNLLLHILVKEGGSTLSAVVTIVVLGHKASNSSNGGVLPEPDNLASVLNTVVFEGLKWNGLVNTLRLLGLGVNLLLPLLSSSTKTEDQVQGGLLLDVVIGKGTSIFQLLSSEDQTLLIRRDSLLVLDLGFDIVNGIRWLNIERDGLACFLINTAIRNHAMRPSTWKQRQS